MVSPRLREVIYFRISLLIPSNLNCLFKRNNHKICISFFSSIPFWLRLLTCTHDEGTAVYNKKIRQTFLSVSSNWDSYFFFTCFKKQMASYFLNCILFPFISTAMCTNNVDTDLFSIFFLLSPSLSFCNNLLRYGRHKHSFVKLKFRDAAVVLYEKKKNWDEKKNMELNKLNLSVCMLLFADEQTINVNKCVIFY